MCIINIIIININENINDINNNVCVKWYYY